MEMTTTGARGAVGEQVWEEDVAEPRTRRGQLIDLFFDAYAAQRRDRLLDVSPVEVDFQASHDRSILPVVAGVTAEQATLWLRIKDGGVIELRLAPAITAVNADIEPGPIGQIDGRDRRRRRLPCQVRRERRAGQQQRGPNQT